MVYLAKGGFWLTLGQVISTVGTFGVAIAFANLLDPNTYGTYKFVLSIAGILSIFTLPQLGTAVTQAVARGFEGAVQKGIKKRLKWGTLSALAGLGAGGYYLLQGNETLALAMLIVAVFVPLMNAFGTYESLILGTKRFKISSVLGVVEKIGYVAAVIVTLLLTNNLFLVLLAYFVPYTLLRGYFFWKTTQQFQKNRKEDPVALSRGTHLSIVGALGLVAANLDSVLLFHFLGAAPLAIYAFAIAPVSQIKGLVKNISPLALPKFAERNLKSIHHELTRKLVVLLLAGTVIAGIYILITPFVFRIFFPQYLESVFFSQVFAGTIAFMMPALLLRALGESKLSQIPSNKWLYTGLIPPVLQIIALFLLIRFGILGVVAARYVTVVATVLLGWAGWQFLAPRFMEYDEEL